MKNDKSYLKGCLFCVFALALILCSTTAFADTIRVPADRPNIQEAIDAASAGDTVMVADGTYAGLNNKNLDFNGKTITVQSENGPDNCIIDCEGDGRGFTFHCGEGEDSVVSGFTITNGYIQWGSAGGIMCGYSSSPTITNCLITGNTGQYGGAIACGVTGDSDTSCPTFINCIIAENTALRDGGGIYCSYLSSCPTFINCTITGNTAERSGGGICAKQSSSPTITNCIFWGNTGSEIYVDSTSSVTVTYSDIQGGYDGEGNINLDPLFVDSANGDHHLTEGSPCIDAGTNDAPGLPEKDKDGSPRVVDGDNDGTAVVDMGAYEFGDLCECDLNHDGKCDMQDWLLFGEDWGRTDCNEPGAEPCEYDLNYDGRCDMSDWLLFGEDWGRTDCPVP